MVTVGQVGAVEPKDHGIKVLTMNLSLHNLKLLDPELRQRVLEQIRYEESLRGAALNEYMSERYTADDMLYISQNLKKKPHRETRGRASKRSLATKRQWERMTPEERAAIAKKRAETRKRNLQDPNHMPYSSVRAGHQRRQKLLAARVKPALEPAVKKLSADVIRREVAKKTLALQMENARLRAYIEANGLPLPGTKADKQRRAARRQSE